MILEGKLFFYSETGTEGEYRAFQDNRFISLELPRYGVVNDRKVWDINDHNRSGIVIKTEVLLDKEWLPWPDPIYNDPDYRISTLYCGEKNGDLLADKRLMERYHFKIKYHEERLNELYGLGNWIIDKDAWEVAVLNDGARVSYGGPIIEPKTPYEISNGLTKVTVQWDDGDIENDRLSNTLLVESWSYDGLHILRNKDRLTILDPKNHSIVWKGKINLMDISREKLDNYFFEKYPAILNRRLKRYTR